MYVFKKDKITIYIGHTPKRKKPALFVEYGLDSPLNPVGYFKSETDMHIFRKALEQVWRNDDASCESGKSQESNS